MAKYFYVSVIDGPRRQVLSGPYGDHQAALDKVDAAKAVAQRVDPRSIFYAFGTCSIETDDAPRLGVLNRMGVFNA
jgi:hypothetical protein